MICSSQLRSIRREFYFVCWAAALSLFAMVGCGRNAQVSNVPSAAGEWHEFQGTWTATGSRNIMRLDRDRWAAISSFNGSLVLAGPNRPGIGFRSEAIVFSDSVTGLVGRAIWTDEHGDKAYSELQGQGTSTHNKITGEFTGGTGRYAGARGTYEFAWRFLIQNDDGTVQGESVGLKGRIRADSQTAMSNKGGSQLWAVAH